MTKTQQQIQYSFLNQKLKLILTVENGCTVTDRLETDVASTEPAVVPDEAGRKKEATAAVIDDETTSNSIRSDLSKNQFEV